MRGVARLRTIAASRLPTDRDTRLFFVIAFADAIGTGLFLAGSALFFTTTLRLSTVQVGIGISLAGFAGLLASVPIGRLADRFGARRVLVVLQALRGAGFLAYPFISGFTSFLIVACLIGAAEWAAHPVIQTVVSSTAAGQSYVHTMAAMTVCRNIGYSLGALVAVAAIALGTASTYESLVLANGVSFLIVTVLLIRLRLPNESRRAPIPELRRGRRFPRRHLPYLLLTVINGLLYLHSVLLTIALPLWIVKDTAAPKAMTAVILIVNTLMAITLQVRLSAGGDDIAHAARKQRLAAWALVGCCVLIAGTGSVAPVASSMLLIAGAGALTLGEIWQSAGAWGLSYGLAPEFGRAFYLSIYSLGGTGASVVGPAILAADVVDRGAGGWLGLGALFACTGLAVPAAARLAQRQMQQAFPNTGDAGPNGPGDPADSQQATASSCADAPSKPGSQVPGTLGSPGG